MSQFILPPTAALDANGNPVPNAKLYFFHTKTNIPATVYKQELITDGVNTTSQPHNNPVLADANGVFPPIFLERFVYKVRLTDASDNLIKENDPYAISTYRPVGLGSVIRPVDHKLQALRSINDFGAQSAFASGTVLPPGPDARPALNNLVNHLLLSNPYYNNAEKPEERGHWGIGEIKIERGYYRMTPWVSGTAVTGLGLVGDGMFASALAFVMPEVNNQPTGEALRLKGYVGAKIEGLSLRNANPSKPGNTTGLFLDGTGGGGPLLISNVTIADFETGIKLHGEQHVPGNGDKGLVQNVLIGTVVGFDQGHNNQAIGWSMINTHFSCSKAALRLSGAGELLVANSTTDVLNAYIQYPESSGNWDADGDEEVYPGSRTTVMSTKLEYTGSPGNRWLIDARESVKLTSDGASPTIRGGTNADLVLRDVSMASGNLQVDENTNVVIEVGNGSSGTDALRVRQDGGWIGGIVKVSSSKTGPQHRRWSHRDAMRAPLPERYQFLGTGAHYMVEWRANENVRLDQYRGGQSAQVSIDSQKSLLLPLSGKYLIDTRPGGTTNEVPIASGKFGKNWPIPLPNTGRDSNAMGGASRVTVGQVGLRVFINEPADTSVTIQQFSDSGFQNVMGSVTIPAGQRGLYDVHKSTFNITEGHLYVRVVADSLNKVVHGRLVFDYFPYLGT